MNDIRTDVAALTLKSVQQFLSGYNNVAASTVKAQAGLVKSGKASSSDMIKTQMIVASPYIAVTIAACVTVCIVAKFNSQKNKR